MTNWLCSELITVLYTVNGRPLRATANLEEISQSWALVLLDRSPECGSYLSFIAQGQELRGIVKEIRYEPLLGWFACLELDRRSPWSEAWFRPKHGLQVRVAAPVSSAA